MFPVFLNLKGRLGVVIGGGAVGRRKATALLRAGATVRVVCLEPRPSDQRWAGLEWLHEPYRAGHLDGAAVAFAAASGEVNRRVARDARERGLWVNVADDQAAGDFFVPATLRRGRLTIAVGTAGAAPALAREIRRRLEAEFDETFGEWLTVLAEVRPVVLARVADAAHRRALFERLCRPNWLARLRREGPDAVRSAMLTEVQTLAASPGGQV
ncbi:MAG TPA: bifunctional precorrin-2 dehydrogenase/sirohydrochlorin ferrochelatase [Gemmataceae bacterium]|jgi:precorrin-2 dehydrogenase/sirohydrochlorin ferrochelatase|nr:bifunctional precorrin-2 dehydrogenase/sirohydrochlorin ferrochelatase [Gemmataceae bacterium]